MSKKESTQPIQPIEPDPNTLTGFISQLNKNTGFSLDKKEKFDPFAVENSKSVVDCYNAMDAYKQKLGASKVLVPISVSKTASGKKVKFGFDKELKQKTFDEAISAKGINNVNLDDTLTKVEVVKN